MDAYLMQCGAESSAAFLTGLLGHGVFDLALIISGYFGLAGIKKLMRRIHRCDGEGEHICTLTKQ